MRNLESDGFLIVDDVLPKETIEEAIAFLGNDTAKCAGTRRLLDYPWCRKIIESLASHPALMAMLQRTPIAIQCTYFDKSAELNWLVALHQDLSIPVKSLVQHPALGKWSEKEGRWFVQSPTSLLDRLLAVRVHLDDASEENGALRVVPGTHRLGKIEQHRAGELRRQFGEELCSASAGAVMLMNPLLLHGSSKATSTEHRRVLHYLLAPADPGFGLEWPD